MNGNPDTAADITQDVFLKLLENIQSVRKIGKFQNYLLTIAVNICNNYTKKAKPLYMDLETLEDIEDTDNAFEKIELNELKAQIQYAINTLPDYQKEVIILRFYYDLKIREIATITKASVSTVKSRLQQGIKKLENGAERLRIISQEAPCRTAWNVDPTLEDLYLYYFTEVSEHE